MITTSAALWADAIHSGGDLFVSIVLLAGLLYRTYLHSKCRDRADQRADKLESLLSMGVAILLLSAPFYLWGQLRAGLGEQITNPAIGIVGTIVVIIALLLISKFKWYVGQQTGSLALEADAHHSHMDLLTSVAVLLSLIGEMVSLNIDKYVASVILLLITLSGLKLLYSSLHSFFGLGLHRFHSLRSKYRLQFRRVKNRYLLAKKHIQEHSKHIYITSISIYLCSGFSLVNLGETGVSYFLSKPINEYLEPGLQYNLPYPLGVLQKWEDGSVLSIQVGSVIGNGARAPGENLWLQTQNQANSSDGTDYLLTGDESLMFVQVEVQYRISDVISVERNVAGVESLIKMTASNALWQSVAIERQSHFVGQRYSDFNTKVANKIQQNLANLALPIEIISVTINRLQPPAGLADVYRDVHNAFHESRDMVNQAVASRLHDIPIARSELVLQQKRNQAIAAERIYQADGEIAKLKPLGDIQRAKPDAFAFNLLADTLENSFEDAFITLLHPDVDKWDLRTPLSLPETE
ncbi:cation transporter [Photobacterium sp. ZSDE20]|nr:cation transporter [Photobacterium sp. ZSDE20]